jgi:hypothetical protein
MIMLVNVYFPTLKGELETLLQHRDFANKIQGSFKALYRREGPTQEAARFVGPFETAMLAFDAQHEKINAALFRLAESIR